MNIKFTDIQEKDLPAIKAIYDWYIKNSTATFHTGAIQEEQLKEFLYVDHPVYKSYMIYVDGALAGYCFLTNYKKRQAYDRTAEVTIYLKPEVAGKGTGMAALMHLEAIAKDRHLKNLIGVITGDNEGSIALFVKAGYAKCAHYKNVGEKFGKILDVVAFQKEI